MEGGVGVTVIERDGRKERDMEPVEVGLEDTLPLPLRVKVRPGEELKKAVGVGETLGEP